MKTALVALLILVALAIAGCANRDPSSDMAAVEATVAQRIFVTLTASAPTAAPPPTHTRLPDPTNTAMPTPTDLSPTAIAIAAMPSDTPVPLSPTNTPRPTATSTQEGPSAEVQSELLNVRAGPGTGHPITGSSSRGDTLEVLGRTEDGSWLNVSLPDGKQGWVSASLVRLNALAGQVQVAVTIPTAPPTPTVAPTPTLAPPARQFGLHERQTIGTWEIQPERVHKERVVYWYGEDYIAMGNYAIVIVLAKNLSSGTDRISNSIGLYLRDDKGRVYDYSDPLSIERYANIAAAWQFVVHPTPFRDIDPGEETPLIMLWDVNADVESLTLVLTDGMGRAEWTLGNFSNIPPYKKE